jgi:hypothetical protein
MKINNLFKWLLVALLIIWGTYCVWDMWYGMQMNACVDVFTNPLCSTWEQLASNLTMIIIQLSLFYFVVNPMGYRFDQDLLRPFLIFPVYLVFSIMAVTGANHSGYVNWVYEQWCLGITLLDMILILIGLFFRWKNKNTSQA